MLSAENLNQIKEIVEAFFEKMTFEVDVELSEQVDNTVPVEIKTPEPQILIGERGQTLNEIQHLLKAMLKNKIEEDFYIDIDINDYKKKKNEYLREMARSAAEEVVLSGFEKFLPPMSAYERRIIHTELSGRQDVISESMGEEPERKVVIKPKP